MCFLFWWLVVLSCLFGVAAASDDETGSEVAQLFIINTVCSALSAFSSVFVLVMVVRHPSLRSFSGEIVSCMVLSDLVGSASHLAGFFVKDDLVGCNIQAFISASSQLSSVLWSTATAFVLHKSYLLENINYFHGRIEQKRKKFHFVIWSFVLLVSIPPLFTGSYGTTGEWCWIKSETLADKALRYTQFYAWLLLSVLYCFVISAKVRIKAQQLEQTVQTRSIMGFPLVLACCWAWPLVGTLYKTATGQSNAHWNRVLVSLSIGLYGTFNALVFSLSPNVSILLCPSRFAPTVSTVASTRSDRTSFLTDESSGRYEYWDQESGMVVDSRLGPGPIN